MLGKVFKEMSVKGGFQCNRKEFKQLEELVITSHSPCSRWLQEFKNEGACIEKHESVETSLGDCFHILETLRT